MHCKNWGQEMAKQQKKVNRVLSRQKLATKKHELQIRNTNWESTETRELTR
jgi:hypothetical protein